MTMKTYMKLRSNAKTGERKENIRQHLVNIDLLNIRYSPPKPPMLVLPKVLHMIF